ncbi:MAG: hypothetical protein GY926_25620 [bacterium]|nr:hypothetical protein [bacterium]MCP4968597.1 hypothetical protein [bacterium]
MITTLRSAIWQGIMAGVVTLAVMMVPTIAILYAAGAGTMGSVSTYGFGAVAAVVLGSIAAAVGYIVYRAFVINEERRAGDVWSTWFTGFVVLVVGSWFAPFIVVFVFIDSDHSLADRIGLVYLVWTVAHLAVTALALRVVRSLWRAPEMTELVDTADSMSVPGV